MLFKTGQLDIQVMSVRKSNMSTYGTSDQVTVSFFGSVNGSGE